MSEQSIIMKLDDLNALNSELAKERLRRVTAELELAKYRLVWGGLDDKAVQLHRELATGGLKQAAESFGVMRSRPVNILLDLVLGKAK